MLLGLSPPARAAAVHRPTGLALAVALALTAAGCMRHATPADRAPEWRHAGAPASPPAAPSPSPSPAAPADGALRVVTFNVHDRDGDAIAAALTASRTLAGADLILLQEVRARGTCSAACRAGEQLALHSLYVPAHLEGPGSEGVAILSRWPLTDVEVIELPFIDVHVNTARRIAVAATLTTAAGPIRVFAVHLDNRISPAERVRQVEPVLARAAAWTGPVVMAGDFNTSPFSWLGHLVPVPSGRQDDRLEAAVRAAGLDTPVTRVGPTSKWLGMRLDAIYTRGLAVRAAGVDRTVEISDHLPLWAVVAPAPAS